MVESRLVDRHKTATQALAVDRIHCNHAVLSNHALLTRTHANGSNCNYCIGPQRVKGVGNMSSRSDDGLVVYELFNKQKWKFRNHTAHRKRRKVDSRVVETEVKNQMILYKSPGFTFSFRTYFMNLSRNKLRVVVNVVERLVLDETIPTRILVLVKDLMAFRLKINVAAKPENSKRESTNKNYMNVMFHNKGMDMINFPSILNSKKVMVAVPNYLRGPPPIVSYTYTRTIAGKIFNNRKVVN